MWFNVVLIAQALDQSMAGQRPLAWPWLALGLALVGSFAWPWLALGLVLGWPFAWNLTGSWLAPTSGHNFIDVWTPT